MPPPIRPAPGIEPSTPRDAAALLESTRLLLLGTHPSGHRPLQGKNIGMLCDCDSDCESPEMSSFSHAATGLGAQVAQIRLGLWDLRADPDLRRVVGVLGRLYDAVVCRVAAPGPLGDFCKDIALPLHGNIARASWRFTELAEELEGAVPLEHKRLALMQAALIRSMG